MHIIARNTATPDWITIVIVGCLALVAVVKLLNAARFNQFAQLVITNKYFLVHGKNTKIFTRFNMLLFLVRFLSISVFLFLLASFYMDDVSLDNHNYFLQILVFYGLFIGLKFYIERIIGTLLSIEKLLDDYLYQKLTYRNLIALLILIFNIVLLYSLNTANLLLVVMVGLLLVLNVISLIYSYKVNEKRLSGQLFYFILYLCALKISPYFILYKILTFQ